MYRRSRCLGKEKCGLCKASAPEGCISFDDEGKAKIDFSLANKDIKWAEICPTKALSIEGNKMSIDEILDIVERDAAFYRGEEGGLTVSGGEPLLQENTIELLKRAKQRHIHTAIETCGYIDTGRLLKAAEYLDEIFMDIKSLNDHLHKEYTGVENLLIRENLSALGKCFPQKSITVRTPVIPGFNDSQEELDKIEDFLSRFPGVTWQKLKYHTYGVQKYDMLGRVYPLTTLDETD